MGGNKRKYNKFAQRKRERNDRKREDWTQPKQTYEDIVRENAEFESYYKAQKICPDEEWEMFMSKIKESLPTAFRITGSRSEAAALLKVVQGEYFKDFLNQVSTDSETSEQLDQMKPYCLPWYPEGFAWQLELTRKDIRRSEAYFRLHNFLIAETNSGNISRQEAVSMIPPIALDIKSHHKILDMCAAPGSKTAQLIEMLHLSTPNPDEIPSGFVVANDIDNNRCYMLVHQAKRLNSPCIVIINHDSAVLPSLTITDRATEQQVPLKFDRILCDVPCSGDGTLRKNPDIWLKWNAANGNNLHGIQSRIIRRGAELLAVGGRLVYSTCSLNPIENEAVIHRLLKDCEGSLQLVDPRPLLPGLKSSPGMTYWKPGSRDLQFYDSFDEVPEKWQTVVRPQMFPPKPEDLDTYKLDLCMRILPHQQNTGAFFVSVLEKIKPLPWEATTKDVPLDEKTEKIEETESKEKASPWGPQRKKRKITGYKEDPFVFFKGPEEEVWPSIREFYSISTSLDPKCLLTRCHVGKKKTIYFCSPGIRDVVLNNENKLKLINTGVKTFVRCDNKNMKCAFRLAQEGLPSIYPFIGDERKISVSKSDLITMLLNDNPTTPPDVTTLTEETQKQVENISTGSCVLLYKDEDSSLDMNMVGWKGTRSLRAYVAKPDTIHMLRLLGGDISKYDINKFQKNADENNEGGEVAENENVEAD